MTDLRNRLASMSAGQLRLLQRRMRDSGTELGATPLSSAQQRIWFVERFGQPGHAFHGPVVVEIDGAVDRDVLERSVASIVARHETLRTTFLAVGDRPMQLSWSLAQLDGVSIPSVTVPSPEESLHTLLRDELHRPFDLARGPLYRCRLFRLTATRWVLMFTIHHIVFDERSAALLLDELAELYTAFVEGRPDPLPPLPVQYPDYALWQHERLARGRYDDDLGYWAGQLAGADPALDVPLDRPRPATLTHDGASVEFTMSTAIRERMEALGRAEDATLFMVLLTGYAALLCRRSGQRDLTVGTPMSLRDRPELARAIGVFLNLIPLRIDASGDPSLRQLLRRVRQTALDAYAHRQVPFERIVARVNPPRDPSRNALYQTVLVLWDSRPTEYPVPGAVLRPVRMGTGTSQVDLAVIVGLDPQGLRCELRYNPALFEPDTARRLVEQYVSLLHAVVADPDRPAVAP